MQDLQCFQPAAKSLQLSLSAGGNPLPLRTCARRSAATLGDHGRSVEVVVEGVEVGLHNRWDPGGGISEMVGKIGGGGGKKSDDGGTMGSPLEPFGKPLARLIF